MQFSYKNMVKRFLSGLFLLFFFFLISPSSTLAVDGWSRLYNAGNRGWSDIATSDSGQYVVALHYNGYVYSSSDYGVTWTPRINDAGRVWYGVTMSADGRYVAASVYGGNIWTSSDYGSSWQVIANTANSVNRNWYSIDSSADGRYLVAVVNLGNIWTSSDYGATWSNVNNAGSRRFKNVTMSDDGQYLATVVRYGNVWTSSNYGVSWTERLIPDSATTYFFAITSTANGEKLAMVDGNNSGYIYTSDNYGVDWTKRINVPGYSFFDISYTDNGSKIIAANTKDIYQSTDNGATWNIISDISYYGARWQPAVYNSDGSRIFIAPNGGYIYAYGTILRAPAIDRNYLSISTSSVSLIANADAYNNHQEFQYSLDNSYSNNVSQDQIFNLNNFTLSIDTNSIKKNTEYNYRAMVSNEFGANYSGNQKFIFMPFSELANDTTRTWKSITSSNDGHYLAAVVNGGYIYTSSDYGQTWTPRFDDVIRSWQSITSSSDGKYLAAVVSGGYIYASSDYGVTWVQKTSDSTRSWQQIVSSSDGRYLAAAVYGGYVYVSSDYGDTWVVKNNDTVRNWKTISISSSGSKLIGGLASSSVLYASSDYGSTWSNYVGTGLISGLTMNYLTIASDNDNKVAIADRNGLIWISEDGGINWSSVANSLGSKLWTSISLSSNGTKMTAVSDDSYIYTSVDSGLNWTEQKSAPLASWQSVSASSDGTRIFAVASSSYIYAYSTEKPTVITKTTSSIIEKKATLNAEIDNTGGETVTTRGFEYGKTNSYGQSVSESGSFGLGLYNQEINSLDCGTTYHYRAFAINSKGTNYGQDITFKSYDCPYAPFVLPAGIGSGGLDETVEMNKSRNIGIIDENGINILTYINSQINFLIASSGSSWELKEGGFKVNNVDLLLNKLYLIVNNKEHQLGLQDSVTLDLDNDNLADLELKFVNIYVNRVEITAKSLKNKPVKTIETIVTEDLNSKNPVAVSEVKNTVKEVKEVPVIVKKYNFTKNLKVGVTDNQVKELQRFLNNNGFIISVSGAGSIGKETSYFGVATKAALIKFQKANSINPSSGYFGPLTRSFINSVK